MKRIFIHTAFMLFIGFIFSGCSQKTVFVSKYIDDKIVYDQLVKTIEDKSYDNYTTTIAYEPMINYNALTDQAIKMIFRNTKVPNRIIVTDFVDLSSLDSQTKLGYVLSNNIKDSLINLYNANVIESEISKHFKLTKNGLKILSRDLDKIKSQIFVVKKVVVGTYTYTKKELIIFVKLVNLENGLIEGSYTRTLPMTESTKMLLLDNTLQSPKK